MCYRCTTAPINSTFLSLTHRDQPSFVDMFLIGFLIGIGSLFQSWERKKARYVSLKNFIKTNSWIGGSNPPSTCSFHPKLDKITSSQLFGSCVCEHVFGICEILKNSNLWSFRTFERNPLSRKTNSSRWSPFLDFIFCHLMWRKVDWHSTSTT